MILFWTVIFQRLLAARKHLALQLLQELAKVLPQTQTQEVVVVSKALAASRSPSIARRSNQQDASVYCFTDPFHVELFLCPAS